MNFAVKNERAEEMDSYVWSSSHERRRKEVPSQKELFVYFTFSRNHLLTELKLLRPHVFLRLLEAAQNSSSGHRKFGEFARLPENKDRHIEIKRVSVD